MSDTVPTETIAPNRNGPADEVARVALKLGFTAFGGPAAHIAMLHEEVVVRRKWLSEQSFLDLLGATNLIPGPNSTEMVIHTGYIRAGWRGLLVAGLGFIMPAATLVMILAWLYVEYGATPAGEWLLYGIKPVIIAVVLQALWGLGRKAVSGPQPAIVGLVVFGLYFAGVHELLLLFGAGLLVVILRRGRYWLGRGGGVAALFLGPWAAAGPAWLWQSAAEANLWTLFLVFLKVGSLLYGSGYVLLAFLHNDLVLRLGWLTDQQLIDAVAVGQFTPGPVFTTATFIGYILAGVPGAIVATIGIFLAAFVLVPFINPLIPKMRASASLGALLDGVNAAALGLMAAVTVQLGRAALVDWLTVLMALLAAVFLFRFKVNSAWLVLGGGLVGLAARFVAG